MKRIYLLMLLFIAIGGSSFAQTDLRLRVLFSNDDTVRWNTAGGWRKIIQYRFINLGPNALVQSTDTIILERAYTSGGNNLIRLYLPTAGIAVGDSASWLDTVVFTSAPTANPWNWCDSATIRRSGSVYADPNPSNNVGICKSTYWKKMPGGLNVENAIENKNGLIVYPNPANNTINVHYYFDGLSDASVVVKDYMGKTILSQKLATSISGEQDFKLDVSSLPSGMYIMELLTNDTKQITKFSINK